MSDNEDSLFTDLAGPMTWPKVAAIAIVCATVIGIFAICGYAPGWQ